MRDNDKGTTSKVEVMYHVHVCHTGYISTVGTLRINQDIMS
jgi:hypothetical protein